MWRGQFRHLKPFATTRPRTLRYWLRIPTFKRRHAMKAGCKFDVHRQQFYIEEPLRPGFLLSDYAAWMEAPPPAQRAISQRAIKKAHGGSSP